MQQINSYKLKEPTSLKLGFVEETAPQSPLEPIASSPDITTDRRMNDDALSDISYHMDTIIAGERNVRDWTLMLLNQ